LAGEPPKIVFCVLENAGSYFKKEKKQADSKTAILIQEKIGLSLFN